MSYEYIKRTYPVTPKVGMRVRHNETNRMGWITREDRSASHYVQVHFDGDPRPLPCHPTSLDYPTSNRYSEAATLTPAEGKTPPGHETCSACGRLFKWGETCTRGGCPCGGDV